MIFAFNFSARSKFSLDTVSNGFKIFVPFPGFKDIADSILDLKILSDDVFVASYPKAG